MNLYSPYNAAKAPALRDLSGELDRFEAGLRALQVEFEKFFNGASAVPPEEQRIALQETLRRYRAMKQLSSIDQFRLSGLEARFNSYHELFNRRLRDREEGRTRTVTGLAPAGPALDAERGVEIDEQVDPAAVEALYIGLSKGQEAPNFDLHAFGKYLKAQVAGIRQKTGCQSVRFRVENEGGKMRLKAKPIKDA
jgi:hypothetical protein